jgi:hypothetical protein
MVRDLGAILRLPETIEKNVTNTAFWQLNYFKKSCISKFTTHKKSEFQFISRKAEHKK